MNCRVATFFIRVKMRIFHSSILSCTAQGVAQWNGVPIYLSGKGRKFIDARLREVLFRVRYEQDGKGGLGGLYHTCNK
jgi:hypothetical protein